MPRYERSIFSYTDSMPEEGPVWWDRREDYEGSLVEEFDGDDDWRFDEGDVPPSPSDEELLLVMQASHGCRDSNMCPDCCKRAARVGA